MNDYLPGQWAVHADIAFVPWKRPEYDASLNRFRYAFISFFDTLKWFIFGHNACRYVKQGIWLTLGSAITSRYRCVHERTLAILTIVLTRWLTVGTKSTATCHCARSCSIVCWLLLLFLFFVLPARTNPVYANQLRPVLWSALNLQMLHSVNPGSLLNRCEPEIWKKKEYISFFCFSVKIIHGYIYLNYVAIVARRSWPGETWEQKRWANVACATCEMKQKSLAIRLYHPNSRSHCDFVFLFICKNFYAVDTSMSWRASWCISSFTQTR